MNYFDIEPPNHAQRWRGVELTDEEVTEATEHAEKMYAAALDEHTKGWYTQVCVAGEPVFYMDFKFGLIPGHIYSELGMEEFKISRSCEYHFDEWTREPDEEEG